MPKTSPADAVFPPSADAIVVEPWRSSMIRRGIALALFASGFASLVYQVVWQRVLTQEIGVDALSMAVIVTIFLAGLGLGAWFGGRVCAARRISLVRTYWLLEAGIGLFGFVSIPMLRWVNQLLVSAGSDSITADLLVNAAVLLPPTFAMGMTTPLAIDLVTGCRRDVCTSIGVFYGINTVGAALGAIAAGFLLTELLGLTATTWVAAGLNLAVAALVLSMRGTPNADRMNIRPSKLAASVPPSALTLRTIIACIAFGFVTLSYETALFRIMSFHFESHVYVFPLVLGAALIAMGVGDAISGILADRLGAPRAAVLLMALLSILAVCTLGVLLLPSPVPAQDFRSRAVALIFVVAAVVPMAVQAAFFPAAAKLAAVGQRPIGVVVGAMLFWYAIGNVLGCYLTAFVLLPGVGTVGTIVVCLIVAAAGAMTLISREPAFRISRATPAISLVLILLVCAAMPRRYYETARQLAEAVEGPEGVVSYRDGRARGGIQVNGTPAAQVYKSVSQLSRPEHDLSLLTKLDPSFRPERVLIVGLGSGNFPWALRNHPTIRSIHVVELSPRVVDFVTRHSDGAIADALRDPRVTLEIGDGRRYLRGTEARGERYDLIQIGTFYPDVAGSANLYSRELMETARKCLKPGGYFMTLDCAGIVTTGLDVFRHGMLIEGMPHYMFFFDHRPSWSTEPPDPSHDHQSVQNDFTNVRSLRRDVFAEYRVNSDDRPWLEFRLLRHFSGQAPNLRARLHKMDPSRFDTRAPNSRSN